MGEGQHVQDATVTIFQHAGIIAVSVSVPNIVLGSAQFEGDSFRVIAIRANYRRATDGLLIVSSLAISFYTAGC
jgi:hypothetical protein